MFTRLLCLGSAGDECGRCGVGCGGVPRGCDILVLCIEESPGGGYGGRKNCCCVVRWWVQVFAGFEVVARGVDLTGLVVPVLGRNLREGVVRSQVAGVGKDSGFAVVVCR